MFIAVIYGLLRVRSKHGYDAAMDLLEQNDWFRSRVQERFVRYVQIHTTSDRHSDSKPSTARQFDLARILAAELTELGVRDVQMTDSCYVIARIPATIPGPVEPIVFLAHMDTAPDTSGENVVPRIWEDYDGRALEIGNGCTLDPADFPDLLDYTGDTLITTDGSTLLGADDKAGVAEIMTAVEYFQTHPDVAHGEIEVVFTPDEEIGRGVDGLDPAALHSKFGFTMDGGREGTIEAECFNAYQVTVAIQGYVIHPGYAKNKMANAVSIAGRFLSLIPQNESPEATADRDGFYCPIEVRGDYSQAEITFIIRDFAIEEVHRRIAYLRQLGATMEAAYPRSVVTVTETKQYLNMADELKKYPQILEILKDAIRRTGVEPVLEPIRGGTDGSRLTEMGLPTPNIFAGGLNFHGKYEWIPVRAMVSAVQTIVYTTLLWAVR